jgi:hypothetical protein
MQSRAYKMLVSQAADLQRPLQQVKRVLLCYVVVLALAMARLVRCEKFLTLQNSVGAKTSII